MAGCMSRVSNLPICIEQEELQVHAMVYIKIAEELQKQLQNALINIVPHLLFRYDDVRL